MTKLEEGCGDHQYIVVFAKNFEIDDSTQKPIGSVGRAVVLRRGQSYSGWRLDEDRWRWHCGVGTNKWVGPVGVLIQDVTQIPGIGSLFTGIFGDWNRSREEGAQSIDIEYKSDGDIVFTTHP